MEIPKYVYPSWMGGSLVIIGVIWPALLRMMVNGGLGRDRSQGFDLRRYKSSAPTAAAAATGTTAQDQQQLKELEENMLASLKAQQAGDPPLPPAQGPAQPQIAKLGGAGPAPESVKAAPPQEKSYQGEYYPVDRTGPDKGQKK
jgi:hypothetical protein